MALLGFSLIKFRVINCSARLICKAPKSVHITPLLYDLHWLPISSWIQYKITLNCFYIVSGTAPPYLSLYSPSCSLCSASDLLCSSDGKEDSGDEIFSIHRTCDLELSSSLCHHSSSLSFFKVKTENPSLLFCILICHFLLFVPTHHQ